MNCQEALQACVVDGNVVKLPDVQLDRKVYVELKKKMEMIGGKWKGGKTAGFVFQEDPTKLLVEIANGDTRDIKKEFQFFATPPELADKMVRLAGEMLNTDLVLEPSAGQGAIVEAINKKYKRYVNCYELMPLNRTILQDKINAGKLVARILGADFLKHDHKFYTPFDFIIANPPFTKNQDIDHIYKMYECLAPGGTIVTLASTHWTFSNSRKAREFREWIMGVAAKMDLLPDGCFKESGTMVSANLIVITKE